MVLAGGAHNAAVQAAISTVYRVTKNKIGHRGAQITRRKNLSIVYDQLQRNDRVWRRSEAVLVKFKRQQETNQHYDLLTSLSK